MSKVLVTEDYLEDIGDAIREKNGSETTYKPSEMEAAILALPDPPVLETLTADANGVYNPSTGKDGFSEVTVAVPTYPWGGADIFINNAESDFLFSRTLSARGVRVPTEALAFKPYAGFHNTSASGYQKSCESSVISYTMGRLQESKSDYKAEFVTSDHFEYSGNVYGNTDMINALGLVLLASVTTAATDIELSDSLENYTNVLIQGLYKGQTGSQYNTTKLYVTPSLNTAYWFGMKDRNASYGGTATFTDNTHATLTGNKQCLIYGMP